MPISIPLSSHYQEGKHFIIYKLRYFTYEILNACFIKVKDTFNSL